MKIKNIDRGIYIIYNIIKFTLIILGLSLIAAKSYLAFSITIILLMYTGYSASIFKNTIQEKLCVERNIYNRLYERYVIYNKYYDSLSYDDKEKIDKLDAQYHPFDDYNEFEHEYLKK